MYMPRRKKLTEELIPAAQTKESLLESLQGLEQDSRFNHGTVSSARQLLSRLDDKLELPKVLPAPPNVSLVWRVGERQLKLSVLVPGLLEYTLVEANAVKVKRKLRFTGPVPMELTRILAQFV